MAADVGSVCLSVASPKLQEHLHRRFAGSDKAFVPDFVGDESVASMSLCWLSPALRLFATVGMISIPFIPCCSRVRRPVSKRAHIGRKEGLQDQEV